LFPFVFQQQQVKFQVFKKSCLLMTYCRAKTPLNTDHSGGDDNKYPAFLGNSTEKINAGY
jgi:hypothetical protein